MFLASILLRLEYPLLRFLKFRKLTGIYTKYGQDIILLQILYNNLVNSNSIHVLEINRPVVQPYSIVNIFLKLFSGTAFLINTDAKSVLLCSVIDPKPMNLPLDNVVNNDLKYGLDVSLIYNYYSYAYSSGSILVDSLVDYSASYSFIVLEYNADALSVMLELIRKSSVKAILIQNNCINLFGFGDNQIRKKLARLGYVFHTRLDNRDDLFVASEMLNGFPSHLFENIQSDSLAKWISEPPDSDYARPR